MPFETNRCAVKGGSRSDAAAAYLHANGVANRANLDILLTTTVTKVLFRPTKHSSAPRVATGVVIQKSRGGTYCIPCSVRSLDVQNDCQARPYTVHARKEVILATGAVNTPLVLMLSGIGPASTLSKYGIPVVINNRHVGQHLQVGR